MCIHKVEQHQGHAESIQGIELIGSFDGNGRRYMKKLGIIGGMGPLATVELFRMIVEMTDSADDSGHIRTFVDNNTDVPDRTQAILAGGESPVDSIVSSAEGLCSLGAQLLLLPCNTSHFFFDEISSRCPVPVINMIAETARVLREQGIKKVGILATDGAVRGGVFDKYMKCSTGREQTIMGLGEKCSTGRVQTATGLSRIESAQIELIYPDESGQKDVMDFIYKGVKAGNRRFSTSSFEDVCDSLAQRGAEALVLGCTEIPVGIRQYGLYERLEGYRLVDTLKVLATTAITEAGYQVKKKN